jgi:hypothetical protein
MSRAMNPGTQLHEPLPATLHSPILTPLLNLVSPFASLPLLFPPSPFTDEAMRRHLGRQSSRRSCSSKSIAAAPLRSECMGSWLNLREREVNQQI